jgi:hypothetical protein
MGVLSGALRQCLSQAPDQLDQLAAFIDPAWIEQALQATGTSSIRRRGNAIVNLLRFANLFAPANISKQLEHLLQQAHLFMLPPQPRAVKRTQSKYPKKKCQSVA